MNHFERVEVVYASMEGAYVSWKDAYVHLVWFGLWFEFGLVSNLLSSSLLKVVFYRQDSIVIGTRDFGYW